MPLLGLGPWGGHLGGASASFSGSVEVKLRLYSFAVAPYQWPALADTVTVDWVEDNVASCSVYLEGRHGERVLLTTTRALATRKPAGTPTKYCGSWVQDYGEDGVVDMGADNDAGGDSLSVYNTASTCFAAQALADYTASSLVFVVTPVDPTLPFTIKYPRLQYTLSASRLLVNESAQDQAVVHPSGPGVRFGDWVWYSGTWLPSPLVGTGAYKSTVVDVLEFDRLAIRGKAFDDAFTSELVSRYDNFEANSVGAVDRNSVGFILPTTNSDWNLALVNTMSEVPPLGICPTRRRDSTTWQPTGPWCQESWIWAQSKTMGVATASPLHVWDTTPAQWTVSGAGVTGWAVVYHEHALTNSETGLTVKKNATVKGKDHRGWHGFFAVVPSGVMNAIWNATRRGGDYHESWRADDDNVTHGFSFYGRPPDTESTPLFVADEARFALYDHGMSRVHYVYTSGSDIAYAQSTDQGRSLWSVSTPLTNAKHPHIAIDPVGGYEIVSGFRLGSGSTGTIVAVSRHLGESSWSAEFTFKDNTGTDIVFEDDTFCFTFSMAGQNSIVLLARKGGASDISRWESLDGGKTWFDV